MPTPTVKPPASVFSGNYTSSARAENASIPSYAPSAPALYVAGGPEGPTFAGNFNCADAGDLGAA